MAVKVNKHSMIVDFPSKVGKKYVVKFKTDKEMTVWFSDDSRKGHNPAKLTGGTGKIITLDALTATKTRTKLFFRPADGKTNTVTDLSIKEVVAAKTKAHARASTCVPFGPKLPMYKNGGKTPSSTFVRKCRRSKTDWPNG